MGAGKWEELKRELFGQPDAALSPKERVDLAFASLRQPVDLLLCPHVGLGCRYLSVPGRTLVGKVWDNGAFVQLRAGEELDGKRRAAFDPLVLQNKRLRFANLSRTKFFNVDLTGADLRRARLDGAWMTQAIFRGARLEGALLDRAQLQGASFKKETTFTAFFLSWLLREPPSQPARLQGASLVEANLQDASLDGAQLQHTRLNGAQLQRASLDRAQLQGAVFQLAQLQSASFVEAHMQGADLKAANMQGATLHGARLQGAMLAGAQLQGALFQWANLQGAILQGASMQGAVLAGAWLHGAWLDEADLRGASLVGAQLQGASLAQAKLSGAWLPGASVWRMRAPNAYLDDAEVQPLVFDYLPACQENVSVGADCPNRSTWAHLVEEWTRDIPEGSRRDSALESLGVLTSNRPPAEAETEQGNWASHPTPQPEAVAKRLGDLACKPDHAPHIARGILFQIWSEVPRNLGAHREILAARILSNDCPGARGLTEDQRGLLTAIAAGRQ